MTTQEYIAARAGISRATVSRILSGKCKGLRGKAAQRVELVRELAELHNYRPHAAARATVTGRFNAIALLLSINPVRSYLPPGLLHGIHCELAERGQRLVSAELTDDLLSDRRGIPALLQNWMADGALLNVNHGLPAGVEELLTRYHIPAVWINYKWKWDAVYPEDLAGAREATRCLLSMGHRRIAYASSAFPYIHYSVFDRQEGYEAAMREAGRATEVFSDWPQQDQANDDRVAAARRWLERPDRPTAIVTYGEYEAMPVYVAAQMLGIRVPQDLSILTFSATERFHRIGLPFSSMVIDEAGMGRAAVALLLKKIADGGRPQSAQAIPCRLEPGATTGPAPQHA